MQTDSNILKNIKLVVFDIDGTLITSKGDIDAQTAKLVKRLQNDFEVCFSFASGRLHSAVTDYAKELNIRVPLISLDGSLIKAADADKSIFEAIVNESHIYKTIKLADRFLVKIALCHANEIFYTENNEALLGITNRFGAKFTLVDSYKEVYDKTLEIFLAGENYDYIKYISEKMSFPYSFGLSCNYSKSQSNKGIYYLEIRKKGCTKKTGLIKLLKYLKLNIRNCAIMGDWYNDLPLFETKAYKVAIENAVPEIKRMADLVTKNDNNNGGVSEFLEKLLKAKMES